MAYSPHVNEPRAKTRRPNTFQWKAWLPIETQHLKAALHHWLSCTECVCVSACWVDYCSLWRILGYTCATSSPPFREKLNLWSPYTTDVMSRSALKSERCAQNNITSRFKSGHLHPVKEQHEHSFVVVFVSTWWVEVKYRLSFLALWEIFLLFSGQNFEVLWQTTGFVSWSLPLLLLLYYYSHA